MFSACILPHVASWNSGKRRGCEEVSDAHSEMLDLAVRLAERAASGQSLSGAERAISDVMWIGTQVSPNGFDGWLAYTSCERMRDTLNALVEIGCTEVADLVGEALRIAGVDPERIGDEERERLVHVLREENRERLQAVDARFYDVYESSMELCHQYAREHHLL